MMVLFLAGPCEICGKSDALATPEQCKAAGVDVDASVCLTCLKRLNPAAGSPQTPEPALKPS